MPKASPPGLFYETLVSNWLESEGYRTRIRQRSKKLGEVDIVAQKGTLRKKILFVECKDKETVSLSDFHKFVLKFSKFKAEQSKARGWLVFSGELHPDVKDYLEHTLDREIADSIELKRKTHQQLRRFTKVNI